MCGLGRRRPGRASCRRLGFRHGRRLCTHRRIHLHARHHLRECMRRQQRRHGTAHDQSGSSHSCILIAGNALRRALRPAGSRGPARRGKGGRCVGVRCKGGRDDAVRHGRARRGRRNAPRGKGRGRDAADADMRRGRPVFVGGLAVARPVMHLRRNRHGGGIVTRPVRQRRKGKGRNQQRKDYPGKHRRALAAQGRSGNRNAFRH